MKTHPMDIRCCVAVSEILDIVQGRSQETPEHVGFHALGLPEGKYVFYYTYRPDFPIVKKVHKLTPAMSQFDILKLAGIDFEAIFGVIDPITNTAAIVPPEMCPGELHMTNYGSLFDGSHSVVSTPYFEGIVIDTNNKSISFVMGT